MNKKAYMRNSSLELLKVFAIVIIVLSHAIPTFDGSLLPNGEIPPYFMDLSASTTSIQRLIIIIYKYFGQFGNAIFVICSSWFLLNSKKVKSNKIINIVADNFVISVLFLAGFLIAGYSLSGREIITQLMPLTFGAKWFISCYLLFYMIHPMMNAAIEAMTQKQHLTAVIIMLGMYSGVVFLLPNLPFFLYYNGLVGFISIYFVVAYMKKYMVNFAKNVKLNLLLLVLSFAGFLALIAATDVIGLKIGAFADQLSRWKTYMNPFILLFGLSAFNIANSRVFYNKFINYISSISLLVYIIGANKLIISHITGEVFKLVYERFTYKYELLWVTLYALVMLFSAVILSVIYKQTLQKLVARITAFVCKKSKGLIDGALGLLMKID